MFILIGPHFFCFEKTMDDELISCLFFSPDDGPPWLGIPLSAGCGPGFFSRLIPLRIFHHQAQKRTIAPFDFCSARHHPHDAMPPRRKQISVQSGLFSLLNGCPLQFILPGFGSRQDNEKIFTSTITRTPSVTGGRTA